jgi:hypothetical protein
MKRTNNKTDYILMRANTISEWDDCDFAIIHITNEWVQLLEKRLHAINPFTGDNSFYHLSYWESPEGFYKNPDDEMQSADEILHANEDWCFVLLEENELEKFPVPENSLDAQQLMVDRYGNASYKAYGKYSNEEFYTADIKITALLKYFL